MTERLDARARDFESRFEALLARKREVSDDVDADVRAIVRDVMKRGDDALADYSRRFDRVDFAEMPMAIGRDDVAAARQQVPQETIDALAFAHDRIRAFHERQRPSDLRFTDALGVELGWRWSAIESVGLYVPGGTASYPSSVLMNAVPAIVAGVARIVMVVPTPDGALDPLVLVAAEMAGVHEIYRVGGAQAVAALAYGTTTIRPVAKIVGPGNAWVAAAKRQVFGKVGIDMVAGPSEVLVLADGTANASWVAADLLAQAEHDPSAQSILITESDDLATSVEAALESQLKTLPRRKIAEASWTEFGAIIRVASLAAALPLVDRIAPEHLEIMAADAETLAAAVKNAGAIFIGGHTPEAIGDYVGGSNHVLPTARSARFSSGLGVLDFMKRTSILKCDAVSLRALAPAAIALGRSERLDAHARSVAIRLNEGIA
jgi:histidinol dehydrogenase